jgi:type IV pilus assembly protein PilX
MPAKLSHIPSKQTQSGLVLLISLIVLVVMTLAAIALVRSMITSNQIANNLALRQGTTAAADLALEKARLWLVTTSLTTPNILNAASDINGYSPINTPNPINGNTWRAGIAWVWADPKEGKVALANSITSDDQLLNANGYKVAYFIQRNCAATGPKTPNKSECDLQKMAPTEAEGNSNYQMTYKITVKVVGPKDTVSFYQSTLF